MRRLSHITLSGHAKRLNVFKVTVSKALRGYPDMAPETKACVKKLTEEFDYTPNDIARHLSFRQTSTIGVVVPKIAHFFFSSVIEAVYDAAFERDNESPSVCETQENRF
ncbi:MAG: hypothetical protein ACRENG_04810 [bacterium]